MSTNGNTGSSIWNEEKPHYFEDDRAVEQAGQRDCEVPFSGDIHSSVGCFPVQYTTGNLVKKA